MQPAFVPSCQEAAEGEGAHAAVPAVTWGEAVVPDPTQPSFPRGLGMLPLRFHGTKFWPQESHSWKGKVLHLCSNVWHKEVLHFFSIIPDIIYNKIKAMIETLLG